MPIYEYRCEDCQQLFEEWCKHVEDESVLHNCPICKGAAKRIMSHNSFALKGGGWYVTEYGSRNKGEKPKAEASAGAGSSANVGVEKAPSVSAGEAKSCGTTASS